MKRFVLWILAIGIVAGVCAAAYNGLRERSPAAAGEKYRTATVRRGDITSVVTSSGTVQPVLSVQVGSFASGPIQKVCVDFNAKVKKGDILAEIDPLIQKAQRNQAKAALDCADANLLQATAKLRQAERDWKRAVDLLSKKAIAETDYDLLKANYEAAKATVAICKATIKQNEATLELAETNLKYTIIESPVDGIVTDRKVDPGQTLASQFQTPVMFVVAPDLEKRVNVLASVDEADIGMIRDAQAHEKPVTFTVDAYSKDTFHGRIAQVRLTPTTVQNVVTYTVVVEAANPELKLLPGMTATLSFEIEKHVGVLRIPNAALRFFPKPKEVRESDRPILEGKSGDDKAGADENSAADGDDEKKADEPAGKTRHVWIEDGDLLSAIEIVTGLVDKSYTEVVSGKLVDGQTVITGLKSR